MASTATASRPTPPASRRNATTSPSPTPASSTLVRGATARSAASRPSPANGGVTRRPSTKPSPPALASSPESKESLTASLKMETDQKEQLLVQLQNKEQSITTLTTENDNLQSALNAAESRVNELYADQARSELELANRIDIADKLRGQVRDLEKEKRDVQRRYNEQMTTFEAERQAFYDNEQHLKSRIQSLMQAKKQPEPTPFTEPESDAEGDEDADLQSILNQPPPEQDMEDPESEPAEMTALKLELSTLSTSYSSLQSTLVLLQTQLMDLKRVNNELQEENESYMILLREKTLSGQFDVMRHVGPSSSDGGSEEDDDEVDTADVGSLRSTGRNTLDRVPEEPAEDTLESELERSLQQDIPDTASIGSRHANKQVRKRTTSSAGRGESLADLPITGPGLDLAAELGRAENKDILEGNIVEEPQPLKGKRARKNTESRKVSTSESGNLDPSTSLTDIDILQKEVKSLKDANKALSLYASKIIDRIIAQEGFEHVLAVDYDKNPKSPLTPTASAPPPTTFAKLRPQSVILNRSTSSSIDFTSKPTTSNPTTKTQRRSLSFDWRGFSLFNSTEKKPEPNLRPLTLKPSTAPIVTGGRKLDTQEDDDDRRERERLAATMKLMGIQPPVPSPLSPQTAVPLQRSASTSSATTPLVSVARRFSLFGGRPNTESEPSSSEHSTPSIENARLGLGVSTNLTHEALEHAEAENSLAALDAHERTLSADIARGASSGFTEIQPRIGRRSRRSAGGSGSGSTVWSAGLSDDKD
ncbi:hypothetical protein BDN72DRAFT_21959 [Pluteus cervinus]|uniref:Uncharacterized protein n=1 Tax=Pluteus cervinus TaxID=181527 RepID=A0ACD3BFU8_9AGAR|nr:hypothetical protein BDN72DRAFT_21959 [Pluteus cervinus]